MQTNLSWTALLLAGLSLGCPVAAAELDPLAVTEPLEFKGAGDAVLKYRLLKPLDFDAAKTYPLVLFLHGAGGRGNNNKGQIADQPGALKLLVNEPLRSKYPCFVLAPQCPSNQRWVDVDWNQCVYDQDKVKLTAELGLVLALLEQFRRDYKVDAQRLYVTGISMGGYGTWDIVTRHPELFAAAIPVCGGCDPSKAPLVAKLPIRAFHGGKDGVVPPRGDREMAAALKAAGGREEYVEFPTVGHDAWNPAYKTEGIFDWLFAQKRE